MRELTAANQPKKKLDADGIKAFVQNAVQDIPTLLKKSPQMAKAKLAEHVNAIRLQPQSNGDYVIEGEWDLLGIRGPVMVAGAGFEPATFGL